MLIKVDGAGTPAPSIVTDEELAKAFQANFGLNEADAADFMRGYRTLHGNPRVKLPLAVEDEHGKPQWMFILEGDTIEMIVERWIKTVPVVAEEFRKALVDYKTVLDDPQGFTQARLAKLKGFVPLSLYFALKALDDDFWDDQDALRAFLQQYPLFQGKQ